MSRILHQARLIVAICCVMSVFCSSRSMAGSPPTTAPSPGIDKLRQEREQALVEAAAVARKLFENGKLSLLDVMQCDRLLLEAQAESAGSKQQRVEILTKAVAEAKEFEAIVINQFHAGLCSALEPLQAKAYRLEIEIRLAKEKA